ncbi:dTMP kinase [Gemmatimonadota bacterium]
MNQSTGQLPGTFITLEGVDGSGKSTQAEALSAALKNAGFSVLLSREPGGTPEAERIRDILLDREIENMAWSTEVLLYLASRAEHVAMLLRPALERGEVVVCDRFLDSTLAYQAFGREGGGLQVTEAMDAIRRANDLATGGLGPDLTFLLDLDPSEGMNRAEVAGRSPDRLEGEGLAFLGRVREGFLALAESEPDRIHVIPAGGTVTDISEEIARCALSYLQRK